MRGHFLPLSQPPAPLGTNITVWEIGGKGPKKEVGHMEPSGMKCRELGHRVLKAMETGKPRDRKWGC